MTTSRTTTDHDDIRRWAEQHGATPAMVKGTAGEGGGMLRFRFTGTNDASLEEVSWDEFLRMFDERGLALVCDDNKQSKFFKFVERTPA